MFGWHTVEKTVQSQSRVTSIILSFQTVWSVQTVQRVPIVHLLGMFGLFRKGRQCLSRLDQSEFLFCTQGELKMRQTASGSCRSFIFPFSICHSFFLLTLLIHNLLSFKICTVLWRPRGLFLSELYKPTNLPSKSIRNVEYCIGCPRNKQKNLFPTETNRNKICFGCVSVCFVKPKTKKFRVFLFLKKYQNMLHIKLFLLVFFLFQFNRNI
jgi:hypothetical protein